MKIAKVYLHSDRCSMRDDFEDQVGISPDSKEMDKLSTALYEVEFDLEVDEKTGSYNILKVTDGKNILHSKDQMLEVIKFFQLEGKVELDGNMQAAVIGEMPVLYTAGFDECPVEAILKCMKEHESINA